MYINMKPSKELVKKLVKETLEQKYTNASASWSDLIDELSKEIKKPIELDDAGNYNVCECEPYHISIRPIVHGICDVQAFKDYSDRTKKLFRTFEEVKKFVKEYLNSKDLNYVDSTFSRNVENSKDKEGGKKADKAADEQNLVDPEKNNKVVKNIKAEPMNKEVDDPTQPMREVEKFERQVDHKSKKPDYKPPTLPKNLQKLVVKYTKGGKTKKK
jgi:hypothetical protein